MKRLLLVISALTALLVNAQENSNKPSFAVAKPHVQELKIPQEIAAKFIQLELIKLDRYNVYDEFDMAEVIQDSSEFRTNCFGISCLTRMGRKLNVDYIISGSFDGLGNKIAISLKWIDVKKGELHMAMVREFDNQEMEIQRMVEVMLKEMHNIPVSKELITRLAFKNELITSNNVGRINNSGPRLGYAFLVGDMYEYARRPVNEGGLDIFPGLSMIGYQFEKQYVGTENFSALLEGIFNFSGLEQGVIIPSFTLLNGFRFGKAGWEFAFGPSFNLRKISEGFFDTQNSFGRGADSYYSYNDWNDYVNEIYSTDSSYFDEWGNFLPPTPSEASGEEYYFDDQYDSRGGVKFGTTWVFGFGRTFTAGALNIPVNLFYSSSRGGGMIGASIGFNVQKSKKNINR